MQILMSETSMGLQIKLDRGFEDGWGILCNLTGSFGILWDTLGSFGFFMQNLMSETSMGVQIELNRGFEDD